MTLDELCREVAGLQVETLRHWIANDWVRPEGVQGAFHFEEIDVARVRLIVTLHEELRLDEEALPVVLSLLDQLHDARRLMLRLQAAIDASVPTQARQKIRDHLRRAVVETE